MRAIRECLTGACSQSTVGRHLHFAWVRLEIVARTCRSYCNPPMQTMNSTQPSTGPVITYLRSLHDSITSALEQADGGAKFRRDSWQRPEGGGGESRVLREGAVFEQAGVNFSHVMGGKLPASATAQRPELAGASFEAIGVSLVIHPRNPYVPTSHANVRYFVAQGWRARGVVVRRRLRPHALLPLRRGRAALASRGSRLRSVRAGRVRAFKDWCDEYFFLKHRDETRGVGGLFFDDLNEWGFEQSFAFMRAVGDSLRARVPADRREAEGPALRRARAELPALPAGPYVEFNLVYDRGTIFGLQTGGRTESILMSLPPLVRWEYDYRPEPGTPEERLYRDFLRPRDWLGEGAGDEPPGGTAPFRRCGSRPIQEAGPGPCLYVAPHCGTAPCTPCFCRLGGVGSAHGKRRRAHPL